MGRNHKNLNNNLEEIRKSVGMTQLELSESADVSRKSINAIENGIYVFNRKLLEFKPDEFKGPDDGKTLEVCESLQYHLPIEHLYISSES